MKPVTSSSLEIYLAIMRMSWYSAGENIKIMPMPSHAHQMLFRSTNGPLNFVMPKYMKFRLSLILRLNAIFTLARHGQLKIMPIPSFKTKCSEILISKQFLANPHPLYWTFTIWSIDSGQNNVATGSCVNSSMWRDLFGSCPPTSWLFHYIAINVQSHTF